MSIFASFNDFVGLVLSRCAEGGADNLAAQAGSATDYGSAAVQTEAQLALETVCASVSAEHLGGLARRARVVDEALAVDGDDTDAGRPKPGVSLARIITGATAITAAQQWDDQGTVSVLRENTPSATTVYGLLSRPIDMGRILGIRLGTWAVATRGILPALEGHSAVGGARKSTRDDPHVFDALEPFAIGVFPSVLLPSLAVLPCNGLSDALSASLDYIPAVAGNEDLYMSALSPQILDAAAATAASKLLAQDPETRGMSATWSQYAADALRQLRPVVKRTSRIRGTYY